MNHKDLEVWKKSIDLVVEVYKLAGKLPNDEKFKLKQALNRKL